MDGMRKVLSALVVLAAGIFWATHGHAGTADAADRHAAHDAVRADARAAGADVLPR